MVGTEVSQYSSETFPAGLTGGIGNACFLTPANFDKFHQEDRIVDHDAAQRNRAHQAGHTQIKSHENVFPNHTDKGEGDGRFRRRLAIQPKCLKGD